jgi:hypothetical protein
MKTIKAIPMWADGQTQEATILQVYPTMGQLNCSMTFYYALLNTKMDRLADGNITMADEDYQGWVDSDDYVYEFVAKQKNLSITGDFVPVTPEPIIPPTEEPIEEPVVVEDEEPTV